MSVERGATARCNEYDVSFLCGVAVDMVHLSPFTFQVIIGTVDPSSVIKLTLHHLSIGFYSREGVYRYILFEVSKSQRRGSGQTRNGNIRQKRMVPKRSSSLFALPSRMSPRWQTSHSSSSAWDDA